MRRLLLLGFALLGLGCPDGSDPEPPPVPPPADAGVAELTVFPAQFLREDEPLRMLTEGGPLQLWNATQGGHVALVGVQVEGVEGDTIELRSRIVDPVSGTLVAEEARTVLVKPVPGDPARKQTDIRTRSQVTHIPLCPNYETVPVNDRDYTLEVRVTELYVTPPRKGSAKLTVRPACGELAEDPALCRCECEAGYTLGKCK